MNIRSLSNPSQIVAQDKVETNRRDLKSDQATDRDGNGQQAFGDGSGYRALTEEEIADVLEKLAAHDGIVQHRLSIQLSYEGKLPFVIISDEGGKVIKKLNERALYDYLFQDAGAPIRLVSRTA